MVTMVAFSSGGARVISVVSYSSRSCIYMFRVDRSFYTSSCNWRIVATIFVCDCVDGGVSIYSMHFALYLAFSCLLFILYSMSRMSTGYGVSSCVFWFTFLVFCVIGSLFVFALAAEPRIKTNFYSNSCASC
jgi:hypothetical protein